MSAIRFMLLAALALLAGLFSPAHAQAPAWPTRPVRFILPFGAGSGIDVGARLLSEKLGAKWGQAVVVENRPGGDGILAMNAFLTANDDHVLLFASTGSYTVHPYQIEKLPYDFKKDVLPIARVANTLLAASVSGKSDMKTLKDFVERAKANPGKLNAAVPQGITELVFDGFVKTEGLDVQKVPYKDIVQAVPDLIEERLNFLFTSYAVVRPAAIGKTARVVAMASRERVPTLPDIPTVYEAGVPSLGVEGLSGLFGPAKMPAELRKRLGEDVVEVMKDPVIQERLWQSGQAPAPGGAAELEKSVQQQIDQVDSIAKLLGMQKK